MGTICRSLNSYGAHFGGAQKKDRNDVRRSILFNP